jgi:hypothetical protein
VRIDRRYRGERRAEWWGTVEEVMGKVPGGGWR